MQEFVNEVISGLQSRLTDCEIVQTTKDLTNGLTKVGVSIRPNGENIAPTIYLDGFYEDNLPVKDTIDAIVKIYEEHKNPDIDVSWFSDFEKVKPMLRARLYNKSTKAEVFRGAGEYGFDDLIIVPYVNISMRDGNGGSIKIMKNHLDVWGIPADEVIDIALGNVARIGKITDMADFMSYRTGLPREVFGDDSFMSIVNITENCGQYGAISAITCRSQLMEIYPDGYYVIPASIHECIVVPMTVEDDGLTDMVKSVNADMIAPEEVLSNHVYKVAG